MKFNVRAFDLSVNLSPERVGLRHRHAHLMAGSISVIVRAQDGSPLEYEVAGSVPIAPDPKLNLDLDTIEANIKAHNEALAFWEKIKAAK